MALPAQPGAAPRGHAPRLSALGLAVSITMLAAACGGAAAGDGGGVGGGGGNGSDDTVISQVSADFGTSMVSATMDGDTLKIVLVDGAGEGMAKLFMCANVEPHLKAAGLAGTKVVISEKSGKQLATEAVCGH